MQMRESAVLPKMVDLSEIGFPPTTSHYGETVQATSSLLEKNISQAMLSALATQTLAIRGIRGGMVHTFILFTVILTWHLGRRGLSILMLLGNPLLPGVLMIVSSQDEVRTMPYLEDPEEVLRCLGDPIRAFVSF